MQAAHLKSSESRREGGRFITIAITHGDDEPGIERWPTAIFGFPPPFHARMSRSMWNLRNLTVPGERHALHLSDNLPLARVYSTIAVAAFPISQLRGWPATHAGARRGRLTWAASGNFEVASNAAWVGRTDGACFSGRVRLAIPPD
jgi:hypothetical protein